MKTVYIFQCSNNKNKYAFSSDNSPINIPHEHCTGEWDGIKEIIISENSAAVIGNSAKKILEVLSKKDYFITELHSASADNS
jgi:hypothetical protein